MGRKKQLIREDDIYEVLSADGGTFEIRYGYYEDFERDGSEPIPIYPDLTKTVIFGASGKRIVTHMQEPCSYFRPVSDDGAEQCCGCCQFYPNNMQMVNACECKYTQAGTMGERSKAI